jgi:hypothetical protein
MVHERENTNWRVLAKPHILHPSNLRLQFGEPEGQDHLNVEFIVWAI